MNERKNYKTTMYDNGRMKTHTRCKSKKLE